jgi:hypothetical protein
MCYEVQCHRVMLEQKQCTAIQQRTVHPVPPPRFASMLVGTHSLLAPWQVLHLARWSPLEMTMLPRCWLDTSMKSVPLVGSSLLLLIEQPLSELLLLWSAVVSLA